MPDGCTRRHARKHVALSLFWRTFFLLALLLAGGVFAWVQTFRALEFEPRAVQAAQQIASLVNLSRAALLHADGINRVALIKSMSDQEAVRVTPREPGDKWEPYEIDRFTRAHRRGAARAARRPTPWSRARSTARRACGSASRSSEDPYWLQADPTRVRPDRRQHLVRCGSASRCSRPCSARRRSRG